MLEAGDVIDLLKAKLDLEEGSASLRARFGPYGVAENGRKVLLSEAEITIRSTAEQSGRKVTDKSVDAEAHIQPHYKAFLESLEQGRTELFVADARIAFLDGLIAERRSENYRETQRP